MSFCNNSIIDVASDRGAIYLGVWDTLNVRQQQFDVSAWLDAYGANGVLTVLNQRRTDDLPYEVADVTLENGVATWTFDETDTAIVGEGKAALVYIRAGETIARTVPFATYTAPTIGMTGVEPPDPWAAWYTRILEESAAAQQAAAHAGVSASNAADAAASAYTQATQAATARSQAVEARNEARAARDEAQAAQGLAETARDQAQLYAGDAQTAATAAAAAKTAAETAKSKAEIAEANAEDAESGAQAAENGAVAAKGAAEAAQAAAEAAAAQAEANKYAAFATEGATAITRFRTLLGADGLPIKAATVKQTAGDVPATWVIRRCGKNLFDADACVFRKAAYINSSTGLIEVNSSSSDSAACETYIPVVPGARIVSQGIKRSGSNIWYRIAFYDSKKAFISPIKYSAGINKDYNVTAPDNAYFMRFCCYNYAIPDGNTKMPASRNVQFEILDDPAATVDDKTAYETYNGEDTLVTVTALDTPTAPATMPTTALGQNIISLFPQGSLSDANPTSAIDLITAEATMDVTYRLDPTLVYESLKG